MLAQLKQMTGEELLLVAVLGGPKVHPAIDRELDRRALMGPPGRLEQLESRAVLDPRRAA